MYVKWKILIAAILWLCSLNAISQQNKIDSLKQLLPTAKDDSARGELLYRLGLAYNRTDYKVSRVLFDSVLRLVARNKHFKRLEADTYLEIGNLGFDHGNYPLSIAAIH
jgi:hypothetical protein